MTFLFRPKKQTWLLVMLYLGLIIFLFATDPNRLAIGWLILPFIWLFLCLFLTALLLLKKLLGRTRFLSKTKTYTIAFIIASLPTLILLLKSIDQLTVKDFVLFVVLYALISFYVSKIRLIKRT